MKMLVAIDIAERGEELLSAAIPWIIRNRATADLIHVMDLGDPFGYVTDAHLRTSIESEWAKTSARVEKRLGELSEQIPETHRGAVQVLRGRPGPTIAECSTGYDAAIIGTHGRKGLSRLWLGSVAELVVRHATIPVLVLHLPGS